MANYITTIKDEQNNTYSIYDSRFVEGTSYNQEARAMGSDYNDSGTIYPNTAGLKAFCWSAVTNSGSRYTFTLSDGSNSASPSVSIPSGAAISIKASYSWSYAGTVVAALTTSSTQVVVDLSGTAPSNWTPSTKIQNPEDGYLWFPQYPEAGVLEKGNGAISFGEGCRANEEGSFSSGRQCIADGRYSFAVGRNNRAGYSSFVEGQSNISSGLQSHAEGYNTKATGDRSHSEGSDTKATGAKSHAEGFNTTASGENSHAEGYSTKATGANSHAEGQGTTASGIRSHAEGIDSKAIGTDSHAEGFQTEAGGQGAHSEGCGTITNGNATHAQGQYNVQDTGNLYADIVGWGSKAGNVITRKNISALTKTGDLRLKGNVYVGCSDDSSSGTMIIAIPQPENGGPYVLKAMNGELYWENA